MFDRKVLVWMIHGIRLVGAPAVGPNPGRAEQLLASAQDDTKWLFVENQGQTCHRAVLPAVSVA